MTLARNIFLARKAINYVNKEIGVLSLNTINVDSYADILTLEDYQRAMLNMRQIINDTVERREFHHFENTGELSNNNMLYKIIARSAYASKFHLGNCSEKAAIAFSRLKFLGARPLDIFLLIDEHQARNNHSFVVLGRTNGIPQQPSTWNHEATICDAWGDQAYPSYLYDNHISFAGTLTLLYRYS
ncbi:hypothetical protein [Xenorhabdus lircayensis]|uniref:Uncharacterized protein n=1 Tax=Xenorhabdus lircayensis TaxID=2763499 RepID=A0ABS0U6V8_9GAMM|nr:hypothetical protein [Xenorhabdus lircayensis]MBI6549610.1 hypothetical protein [Xenorhabdus lircayensis]